MDARDLAASIASADLGLHVVQQGEHEALIQLTGPAEHGYVRVWCGSRPPVVPAATTRGCYLAIEGTSSEAALGRLVGVARQFEDGSPVGAPPRPEPLQSATLLAAAALGALALVVGLARRGRVRWTFRLPHLLPAVIQSLLLAYWALYWPAVLPHLWEVLAQIALAYAVDALVMLVRFGQWSAGFAPLPIVLSANLFAWFGPAAASVVVVVAVASRALLRRGGRHVFNPSAAGLTVAGALSLFFPLFGFTGVFHTMNAGPNMTELIVLLAIVPQLRFPIVLISLGAWLGIHTASMLRLHGPDLFLPGTLLALVLFATDPATTPRTPAGKLLFGWFYGLGMWVISTAMVAQGVPDDLSKVMPIPVANALVPFFDHLGRRSERWNDALLGPKGNLVLIATWLAIVSSVLPFQKPGRFEGAMHWSYATPLVVRGADDVPRCVNNPTFCEAFTFVDEISLWVRNRPAPAWRRRRAYLGGRRARWK